MFVTKIISVLGNFFFLFNSCQIKLQEGFGEGEFVNLGWGKKETQFHGTEGKEARVRRVEEGAVADTDDRRVRVSWRGDGEMLTVSYVTPVGPVRKLRVFDRKGALYSTSEECAGLEQALAWKPSGNLIAATVRRPNKLTVGFFEKNGLQHGELPLRTEMDVKELEWNCDSSVLMVWGAKDGRNLLQFWTVGNYHWYLKQSLELDEFFKPRWDQEDPNLFHYFSKDGEQEFFSSLTFSTSTDTSLGRDERDLSLVAVVDGNVVKVTPMREAVIPPPMSAYELHFPSQVLSVLFPCGGGEKTFPGLVPTSNNLAVVTAEKIYFFSVLGAADKTESGDGLVRITGAGGNGYIVQTSRHGVVRTLETAGVGAELTNLTWVGEEILASVDYPAPAVLVLQVELYTTS